MADRFPTTEPWKAKLSSVYSGTSAARSAAGAKGLQYNVFSWRLFCLCKWIVKIDPALVWYNYNKYSKNMKGNSLFSFRCWKCDLADALGLSTSNKINNILRNNPLAPLTVLKGPYPGVYRERFTHTFGGCREPLTWSVIPFYSMITIG